MTRLSRTGRHLSMLSHPAGMTALLLSLSTPLWAALPDSGSLLREQYLQPTSFSPIDSSSKEPLSDPATTLESTVDPVAITTIEGFRFIGNFPEKLDTTLQMLSQKYIGHSITLEALNEMSNHLSLLLQQKGYALVRVSIPPQEIEQGIVTLQILIAELDHPNEQLTVSVTGTTRTDSKIISDLMQTALCPDLEKNCPPPLFLESRRLERGVLIVNDLPGISGILLLEPGESMGTTKVTVEAQEAPLFSPSAAVDNFGNPYSGTLRTQANLFVNSPFGFADQLGTTLTLADHLQYGHLQYELPLGYHGTRGYLSCNQLHYSLHKEFAALEASGAATTLLVGVKHPLVKQRMRQITVELTAEQKQFRDHRLGLQTEQKTLPMLGFTLHMNHLDPQWGGGLNTFRLQMSTGQLHLRSNSGLLEIDQETAQTQGSFTKWAFFGSRTQPLSLKTVAYVSLTAQKSDKNLDSSEKMSLGGPHAIRAYSVGEGSGDEGALWTIELRHTVSILATPVEFMAFFDQGFIRFHHHTWLGWNTDAPFSNNHQMLQGLGTGFNFYYKRQALARFSYAQHGQFWLQGYASF